MFAENLEISDYLQEGDAGFKKPKVSRSLLDCEVNIELVLLD